MTRHTITMGIVVMAAHAPAAICLAEPFTYQIDVALRYDVVAGEEVLPDTLVWGMPQGVNFPSGTLELLIDESGNVLGSSPVDPNSGLGMLLGQRLHGIYNPLLQLDGGSLGTPVANVAPISAATVRLGNTFLGDFSGLNDITGFIEDGNSGDYFNLSNGIGLDGKFEFTASGPDGMSITFNGKGYNGTGTGWYTIAFDGGDIGYVQGTNAASVGLTGVIPLQMWIDASAHTFAIPEQTLLYNFPATWGQFGRRITDFSGLIDPNGSFAGTASFAGIEFTSVTGATTAGFFEDGNSTGFDAGDGLMPGDSFTTVLSGGPGSVELVINGTWGGAGTTAIPTVSQWGMVAMTLLLITAGTLLQLRRGESTWASQESGCRERA